MAETRLTAPVWHLVGKFDETEAVRKTPIVTSPFRIGRCSKAHLRLSDPCAYSLHAVIITDGGDAWIRDLGSTNGTYVNHERLAEPVKLQEGDFIEIGSTAAHIRRDFTALDPESLLQEHPDARTLRVAQFDRLISENRLEPCFQPIVHLADETCVGYEMLIRSRLFGLQLPKQMFHVAAQLDMEAEFSALCRIEGLQAIRLIPDVPNLFLNTHPAELNDLDVLGITLQELREASPNQPITLEVHEAAVAGLAVLRELRAMLTDLDMCLAYDDFGAGQSRFQILVEVPPDYLKYDMSLTRGVHAATGPRQQMIATLVAMTHDLGIAPQAKGIECLAEAQTCQQLGFELGQGYLYGKPKPIGESFCHVETDTDSIESDTKNTTVDAVKSR